MDTIQNFEYLFVAYTIVWVVLFGYFFFLTRQLGDLRREVKLLREEQEEKAGDPSAAGDA